MGPALRLTVTHSLRRAMAPGLYDQIQSALAAIPVEASVSLGLAEGGDAAWSLRVLWSGRAIANRLAPSDQSGLALASRIRRMLDVAPPRPPYRPALDCTAALAQRQAEQARGRARVAALAAARSWEHMRFALAARSHGLPAPLGPNSAASPSLAGRSGPPSAGGRG